MLALLAVATPAAAWNPLRDAAGAPVRWPDDAWPLPLADDVPAWARAAATWTQAGAVGFRPVPATPAAPDGVVSLARIDDAAAWQAEVGDPALVAFTLVQSEAGRIRDADVLLNTARFRFADPSEPRAFGLEAVLVHELGHVLGLGHSCGADVDVGCFDLPDDDPRRTAAMAPQTTPGEAARVPDADDLAGLATVAPPGLPVRRLALAGVETLTPGRWRAAISGLRPGDLVRARRGAPVAADVRVTAGEVEIASDAAPPLDLEAWSAEGQGVYVAGALPAMAADAGPGDDAGPARSVDDGCAQTPSGAAEWPLALFGLLAWRRRG